MKGAAMTSARPGIWVMLSGVFLAITGGAAYATCSPDNPVTTAPSGCGGLADLLILGGGLVVVGIVVAVVGHVFRTESTAVPETETLPAPAPAQPPPVVVRLFPAPATPRSPQRELTCPYCGEPREDQGGGCPACGAWSATAPAPGAALGPAR